MKFQKAISVRYVYGAYGELLAQYSGLSLSWWNILASGETIGRAHPDESRYYYLKDHLGSVRVTVNDSGTAVGWDDYFPFGLQMPGRSYNQGNAFDDQKFTGHFLEQEGGLGIYHAVARMYDPETGRFLGVDAMNFLYPSSNSYHYVFNNPISFRDPSGMLVERTEDGYRISGDDLYTYIGYLNRISEGTGSIANLELALDLAADKSDGEGGDMDATGRNFYVFSSELNDPSWSDFSKLTGLMDKSGSMMENIDGTFRMTNAKGQFDFRHYKNGWRGNQHVTTLNVAATGRLISNAGSLGGGIVSGGLIYHGFQLDGNRFGYNAQVATGKALGGVAGAKAGAIFGAKIGAFGGPKGMLIGGFVGGVVGGIGGSLGGEQVVNSYHLGWSP